MKKVILLVLLTVMTMTCSAQKKYKKESSGDPLGIGITASGVAFSVAGFLTPPDYTWVSTTPGGNYGNSAGNWKKLNFMNQGSRSMCIVTGVTLTVCGLITMVARR